MKCSLFNKFFVIFFASTCISFNIFKATDPTIPRYSKLRKTPVLCEGGTRAKFEKETVPFIKESDFFLPSDDAEERELNYFYYDAYTAKALAEHHEHIKKIDQSKLAKGFIWCGARPLEFKSEMMPRTPKTWTDKTYSALSAISPYSYALVTGACVVGGGALLLYKSDEEKKDYLIEKFSTYFVSPIKALASKSESLTITKLSSPGEWNFIAPAVFLTTLSVAIAVPYSSQIKDRLFTPKKETKKKHLK